MDDEAAIVQVIHRFANAFDLKDWQGLESCLLPQIHINYSDLRGTDPETIEARRFVGSRREALADLATHHLCGNHEIQLENERAACRTSMIIYRLDKEGQEQFITHCVYLFELQKTDSHWKIGSITQKVFWNEGNPSIHKGTADKRP